MNPPFLKSLVGGAFAGFRMLHTKEIRQFGEVRTQRLVLEAWDRLFGGG
jgi:hypothetical protein